MLLSKNWLQDYVNLDGVSPEELAEQLTMKTVEVEGVSSLGDLLDEVVVGAVATIEKHPDADKLQVCHVDIGNEQVQVVCGGSNLRIGMHVALGKIGAQVKWHGEGEPVELTKTKIRGVESFGMICASDEIGLGELFPKAEEKEILDLTGLEFEIGTPLMEALSQDDVVIDIDNKSMTHRPDLWGHYGMAREIAAFYQKKLQPLKLEKIKQGKKVKLSASVKDKELCPRYMAVAMDGITIEPSPAWMQAKLQAVGVRPINNIVDITNYVMLETGQPMHAFDASKIGHHIIVRPAKKNETIETLDGGKQKLTKDMLVIADDKKAIALAGVIGGANSEVSNETVSIVLESANFHAKNIRRTSVAVGVRTDSSSRFEKSLDPNNCEVALQRAVSLIKELVSGASVSSNVVDESSFSLDQGPIQVSLEYIEERIGEKMSEKEVVSILERLGFSVKSKRGVLRVTVPTWRATKDIHIAEDVVEEVARMYGYDNIEPVLPAFPIVPPAIDPVRILERRIKEQLAYTHGFVETMNYSFVSAQTIDRIGLDIKDYLELENPVAKDRPYVRRHLIPNLLEKVEMNEHNNDVVKLFEIGKVFRKEDDGKTAQPNKKQKLPRQDTLLGIVFVEKGNHAPFHALAEVLRGALGYSGADINIVTSKPTVPFVHPGRHAILNIGDEEVGTIAELHPGVQELFGIGSRVAMVQINLSTAIDLLSSNTGYTRLPMYPSMVRDIAFLVSKEIQHADIVHEIKKSNELVVNVELFDVFVGKKIGDNKKSVAYHIEFRSDKKTLETGDVDKIEKKIKDGLKKKFDAEIRD